MTRIRVGVILGGRSSEHSISCISARSIVTALDPAKYDVSVIGISPTGRWVQAEDRGLGIISDDSMPVVANGPAVAIERALDVDVVFPVLHGPWGEDGTVQGLLETLDVPYVGPGVLASAVGMDKAFMKAALAAGGLHVGPYEVVTDREWTSDRAAVLERIGRLGLPVFVKPARAGSSQGITKVKSAGDLAEAIVAAREHDPRIVVEASLEGVREVECGVLAGPDGAPMASRCAEIIVNERHDFYDFEAKYLDDSATLVVPADLPPDLEAQVRALAVRAFEALDCDGLSRVDFFITPEGKPIVNEVNTMPGFTSISMYPRMWAAAGIEYPDLVDRLIADALRKGTGLH